MKKPYSEPEIEIENITSLNTFLEASPDDAGGWEDKEPNPDDGLDEWS